MVKRIRQVQDFPMGSQAEGFGQQVVMRHSELEQGEPTAAATETLLSAHSRGPRHTAKSSPTPAEGF